MKSRYFIITLLLFGICLPSFSKKKESVTRKANVYMVGFAASFIDSVAYVTGIQKVDTVTLDTKTKFLLDRTLYSSQLQSYIEGKLNHRSMIPTVFFSEKKRKMEKQLDKITRRYTSQPGFMLSALDASEFHFHAEEYIAPEVEETTTEEKGKKAGKSKKKSASKGK